MYLRPGTIFIGALLVAGCTSATTPTTAADPALSSSTTAGIAATSTTVATSTSVAAPTTESSTYSREIGGVLPDGTPYVVRFETPVDPTVLGISAAIMIEQPDGSSRPIGRTVFIEDGPVDPGLDSLNRYRIPSGRGGVTISIYDDIAGQYSDLAGFLDSVIAPGTMSKNPSLELSPPLRWASDAEIPLQMEVQYNGFVVRRGCGQSAVACSETGAVQVIPANAVYSSTVGLPAEPVWIESTAGRLVDSPSYLDPGPLSIRGSHDVLWTGEEMIVWGGADGDRLPNLIDGAAFDPASSTWRMLAPIPLDESTVTRAVWAGDVMIVVSREATFAYDPAADNWSVIGDGIYPPEYPGLMVDMGAGIAAWTSSGIQLFTPDSGTWTLLPGPGFGTGEPWTSAVEVVDATLYAIGSAGLCGGRTLAYWNGTDWVSLGRVELDGGEYSDCSYPHQTGVAGAGLVVWDSDMFETVRYDPVTNRWSLVDTIPLGGTDFPSGSVPLGGGFLVPQHGEAAIFDGTTSMWTRVVLPGGGEDIEMVWTGEEILMWGWECCYGDGRDEFVSIDAWRWTPPG